MKQSLLNALAWLTGVSKKVLEWLLPILASATATALETLLPVALQIVASLAASELSGENKRKEAVEQLKAAALQAGITASASVLNLAVEMAVAKLKEAK